MPEAPTGDHVVVDTPAGSVRGRWRGGSATFLGIPFAEPPFGERRFLAPEPRAPWQGVRDALAYGPTPQRKALAEITTIPEPSIPGEDVLSVNVFTPRPDDAGPLLPVLVYVHGGGYVAGSPASPWYDGAAFNRDGVVVVTVSYRLGFEGFGLLPDAPANRGVLDWLLALEWVRDTIARFGGDPARVTISGQSAGGGAVMTLLTLPRARGLFARAISISGVPADLSRDAAAATTAALAERLGVSPDRAGFAAVSEDDLIRAQGSSMEAVEDPTAELLLAVAGAMDDAIGFGPVVDGELVPFTVPDGIRAGAGSDVPLIVGATAGEFSGITVAHRELFADSAVDALLATLGLDAATAERFAAALAGADPAEVVGQVVTDRMFRARIVEWLALRSGPAHTWAYDFTWRSAVSGVAEHCLDVPFVFDLLDDPDVLRVAGPDAPQALADRVHAAHVAFITDGDPGWPAYDAHGSVFVEDVPTSIVTGGFASARALIA